jgi:nitroimidazol reductase NimA-like FMN-containing flavoprotein (pyridoxamine 5'-phosphate oxidase superfamily)/GNAT superfamily N-acetyltransferase
MRKEIYRLDQAEGRRLLARAPVVHLASTKGDGAPVLRTLHAAIVDDDLVFHGAPAGEKMETLGRDAVLSAEEIVASIPSYFVDPERACPATTFYCSVQVHGALTAVDDLDKKARALAALMDKYQPEGGFRPIDARDPLYRKSIAGLLVVAVPLATMDAKAKLGQNRKPEELVRLLEHLWARGLPGDPRAIELVRRANPGAPVPAFLAAPNGARLATALEERDAAAAAALLEGAYWLEGVAPEAIRRSHLASPAWVGAHDERGRLVATARAIGDTCGAWVYDVFVDPAWRGRGVGRAVVRLLLDHPLLRHASVVRLRTRDAEALYASFGFTRNTGNAAWTAVEMVFRREARDAQRREPSCDRQDQASPTCQGPKTQALAEPDVGCAFAESV